MSGLLALAALAIAAPQGKPPSQTDVRYLRRALSNGRPVVLTFFAADCPSTPQGVRDMSRLATMLKGKIAVYGFFDLPERETQTLAKRLKATFKPMADPTGAASFDYGARNGLDVALLDARGRVPKILSGYDRRSLSELLALVSKHGGPRLSLDLSSFPTARQSGCPLRRPAAKANRP